jgi:hypothetical protein
MPLPLRTFTWNKMKQFYEQQNNEESNNVVDQSIANMRAAGAVAKPQKTNVPDYATKLSKK